MTTTPDALAADYVGRHRLSHDLAADMTTELTEWMTWTSGKPAATFAGHMAGCTTCTKAYGTRLHLCPVGQELHDSEQALHVKVLS